MPAAARALTIYCSGTRLLRANHRQSTAGRWCGCVTPGRCLRCDGVRTADRDAVKENTPASNPATTAGRRRRIRQQTHAGTPPPEAMFYACFGVRLLGPGPQARNRGASISSRCLNSPCAGPILRSQTTKCYPIRSGGAALYRHARLLTSIPASASSCERGRAC
jgi:hypothetical protein